MRDIGALVRRAASGDEDAFNALYRATRDKAWFVALSLTKNEDAALDILQDAYLKAWEHLGDVTEPEGFQAWFNCIAANTARNYLKKKKPLLFGDFITECDEDPLDLQQERGNDYIPDARMDTEETRRLIMEIIDDLPEEQRLIVLLFYYDEMDLHAIARSLGISYEAAKSRLRYARKKIGAGVEALEKKGTKLYSAAPVPLLIFMLKQSAKASANALPPVILGGASAAAGTVVLGLALPKFIAALAAASVVIGGTAAASVFALREKTAVPVIASTASAAVTHTITSTRTRDALSLPEVTRPTEIFTVPVTTTKLYTTQKTIQITATQYTTLKTSSTHTQKTTKKYVYTNDTATKAITTREITSTTKMTAQTTATTTLPAKQILMSNGVAVEYMPGALPDNTQLTVTPGALDTLLLEGGAQIGAWAISLSARPGGVVSVKLPIPAGADRGALQVYHSTNGAYAEMPARLENEFIVFDLP